MARAGVGGGLSVRDAVCRSCGAGGLEHVYTVRSVPTHSCLVLADQTAARTYPTGDVDLGFCRCCAFIQNTAFDPAMVDYGVGYEDSQAHSPTWVEWAARFVADLAERHDLRGGRALEIGCGKGDFLALLASVAGMEGIGYDPAFREGPLVPAVRERLTFHQGQFTTDDDSHDADLVCARHVLEHVHDPAAFLDMVRAAIGDRTDTVVVFEVPGSERILRDVAFWDVYYEHCSYFTAPSLRSAFERADFDVVSITSAFDGQYLIVEALPGTGGTPAAAQPARALEGVGEAVQTFRERVADRIEESAQLIARAARNGGRTVLWGAGSKAVGCLTTLGLRSEVAAVIDIDPAKQGGYLAGTGHPVVAPDALVELSPDRVVVMNAAYMDEIEREVTAMGLHAAVSSM